MNNFSSFHYWINSRPEALAPKTQTYFIFIIGLLILFTAIFGLLKKKKRGLYFRIWQKLYSFFLSNFIIGLFLLFFTYEMVPFLSARAWFLLWAAGMIAWLVYISLILVKIPKIKQKKEKEKEYKKYLP